MTVTVLLVDDHELIRRGLRMAFERDGEFTVVGEASTVQEALAVIEAAHAQIVVLDLTMPDGSGFDVIHAIRARDLDTGIVVCSVHPSDDVLLELLKVGASAFVSKESPVEDVIAAARYAFVSPRASTARDLAGAISRRSPGGPQLSPRERDVLALLKDEAGVAQIAEQLYISKSAARVHIARLHGKLGRGHDFPDVEGVREPRRPYPSTDSDQVALNAPRDPDWSRAHGDVRGQWPASLARPRSRSSRRHLMFLTRCSRKVVLSREGNHSD